MASKAQPQSRKLDICIIGAGVSGLAALKVLRDSEAFRSGLWTLTAYESRGELGGVWVPALPVDEPPLTPLYDSLRTNIPHPVMAYSSFPFPPGTNLFPPACTVLKYIQDYAHTFSLRQHIQFNATVLSAKWDGQTWVVRISTGEERRFHRLVVANGHHRVPYYPPTPGLQKWVEEGMAIHSVYYRRPEVRGAKVLIVGGGPSAIDVGDEMRKVSASLVQSVRGASPLDEGNCKRRGEVARFEDNGTVVFKDGTREEGIDYCILATGYHTSFPFLKGLQLSMPDPPVPLPRQLHDSSHHIFPLAMELFPLQEDFPPTSIAFVGLLVKVTPFPLSEAQAHAIVKAFSDPDALDVNKESEKFVERYKDRALQYSDPVELARHWHFLRPGEQPGYRDGLHEFAGSGPEFMMPEWEKKYFEHELRYKVKAGWNLVEAAGLAEEWVKGVGEGRVDEWVDFMGRVAKHADDNSDNNMRPAQ